jgi:hypothetical protein
MGALPLNPWAVNFTDITVSHPSLLSSLKNANKTPSLTWGYTAGMVNHNPPIFGSLTIGGFDQSRFTRNDLNFSMATDISRDLVVAVQSVTSDKTSSPLLQSPIFAFINSLVPYIWLPLDACQAFEKAFNLTWDDTSSLYLVDGNLHQQLLSQNPTVTFKIGMDTTGNSVSIDMPYGSFDLNASAPLVANSSRYFPLKRADNSTQYTLGRAFLQNAYVIANYEYFNFSVSQALYPSTTVSQNIIMLPGKGSINDSNDKKSGLGLGAIIGIAVGGGLLAILAIAATWWFCIRKKPKPYNAVPVNDQWGKYELDAAGRPIPEADGNPMRNTPELADNAKVHEAPESHHVFELATNESAAELETPPTSHYNSAASTPAHMYAHPYPRPSGLQQHSQQATSQSESSWRST